MLVRNRQRTAELLPVVVYGLSKKAALDNAMRVGRKAFGRSLLAVVWQAGIRVNKERAA